MVLAAMPYWQTQHESREIRSEFSSLEKEFGAEARFKLPSFAINQLPLAKNLTLAEALLDIAGSHKDSFRNRTRPPLKRIIAHSQMIEDELERSK